MSACEHSGARLTRMCCMCRKHIADGAESLALNGMFAHIACVEMALREPWSMEQVTDDQLRAECERRFAGPVNEYTRMTAECDEWKRRAEAAEAKLESMKKPPAEVVALLERAGRQMRERGSGIDSKPHDAHYVLDEDLLCEDI